MRIALAFVLFTMSAFAQDSSAVSSAQAACGPKDVNFDVEDDNSPHTVGQPEAGKALVYVIQDIGSMSCVGGCVTTKVALDGAWIGANHHNSYLSFAVDPGERHLCANWQSHFARLSRLVGLAVIFQDVVHSIGTREADCDEQSSFRGKTEWTFTRMPDSPFGVERRWSSMLL